VKGCLALLIYGHYTQYKAAIKDVLYSFNSHNVGVLGKIVFINGKFIYYLEHKLKLRLFLVLKNSF
jgi:hypothetical protein